ncbi:MAG: NPCBM/NEW2 domain-containing protein, partial [bacterium]
MNHCPDSSQVKRGEMAWIQSWRDILLGVTPGAVARLRVGKNGWGAVMANVSYAELPLRIGGRDFAHGLACHADSELTLQLAVPARRFHAWVGIDQNPNTDLVSKARIIFSVEANGRELWRSAALTVGLPPVEVDLAVDQASSLTLKAVAEDGNVQYAHADWAAAQVELANGRRLNLAECLDTRERIIGEVPFSFQLGQQGSADWISLARAHTTSGDWRDGQRIHTLVWQEKNTKLRCEMELTEFSEFPALEWVVRLRNDGRAETVPVTNFKALDIFWNSATPGEMPELRRALGSDGGHDDFQYRRDELRQSMWNTPRT